MKKTPKKTPAPGTGKNQAPKPSIKKAPAGRTPAPKAVKRSKA